MVKKQKKFKDLSEEIEDILARPTADLRRVGRVFFNISPDAAYAAARNGDLATKRVGKRILVLTAPLRKLLSPNAK